MRRAAQLLPVSRGRGSCRGLARRGRTLGPHFVIWVWGQRHFDPRSAARGIFLSFGSETCDILGSRAAGVNHEKQSRSKRSTRSQLRASKSFLGNPQPDQQKCQNKEGRLTKIIFGLRLSGCVIARRGVPGPLADACALHRSRLCGIGSVCQVRGQQRARFSLFRWLS